MVNRMQHQQQGGMVNPNVQQHQQTVSSETWEGELKLIVQLF
jgi:hypothetical protein